jgi:hypothetical protein
MVEERLGQEATTEEKKRQGGSKSYTKLIHII